MDEKNNVVPWAVDIFALIPSYGEMAASEKGVAAFFFVAAEDVRPFLDLLGVESDQWGTKRRVGEEGGAVEIYCGLNVSPSPSGT
jgi:hypothetical protein